MDTLQNILVLIIFALALGFLVGKFVWKPAFLKKKIKEGCGEGNCGCH